MKKTKIIYWVTTMLIFLFEGVMPALTSNSQLAIDGIRHLGYPDYFRVMLTVFKVAGALVLILPFFPSRLKEWAYAGFAFAFVSASVSNAAIFGIGMEAAFPLLVLLVLMVSYIQHHKLLKANSQTA
jgi:hypothetical protein